jgi:2-methylisocitrate lyase-like PEP mutase family enzyme
VVSRDQAIGRIKAALDARTDPDFVIAARTDADVVSIDEVIERCNLYLDAGADMAMPSFMMVDGKSYYALSADEQMGVFRRLTSGINGMVMSLGVTPPVGYTATDMGNAGLAFIMFAGSGVSAVANALSEVFKEIRSTGTDAGYFRRNPGEYSDPVTLMKALKLDQYVEMDRRFSPP